MYLIYKINKNAIYSTVMHAFADGQIAISGIKINVFENLNNELNIYVYKLLILFLRI